MVPFTSGGEIDLRGTEMRNILNMLSVKYQCDIGVEMSGGTSGEGSELNFLFKKVCIYIRTHANTGD